MFIAMHLIPETVKDKALFLYFAFLWYDRDILFPPLIFIIYLIVFVMINLN